MEDEERAVEAAVRSVDALPATKPADIPFHKKAWFRRAAGGTVGLIVIVAVFWFLMTYPDATLPGV